MFDLSEVPVKSNYRSYEILVRVKANSSSMDTSSFSVVHSKENINIRKKIGNAITYYSVQIYYYPYEKLELYEKIYRNGTNKWLDLTKFELTEVRLNWKFLLEID